MKQVPRCVRDDSFSIFRSAPLHAQQPIANRRQRRSHPQHHACGIRQRIHRVHRTRAGEKALRQLETEGLVETLPRRGVLIRFNAGWAEEMILARAALESMIAHLAAKRIEKTEAAKLEDIVSLMRKATEDGVADDLISLNETFHEQIHIASRCQYLSRMIERQQFYDGSIRRVIHSDPLERGKALAEHAAIAAAIISSDSDKAERVMRDHVVRSGETYLNIVFKKKEDI